MRITIDNFVLADHGRESVNDFRINGHRAVQESQFLRGPQIEVFARGNRKTAISFKVKRLHPSGQRAEKYILEHDVLVPEQGLVTLTARDENGAEVSRWLANACIETTESNYTGASTEHSYNITGGKLLTATP